MIEVVEDSGIDCEAFSTSDRSKIENLNRPKLKDTNTAVVESIDHFNESKDTTNSFDREDSTENKAVKKLSELSKKIEKAKSVSFKRSPHFLPRNRLKVPGKAENEADIQPLVLIDIDSSDEEEELNLGRNTQPTSKLLKQQPKNDLETSIEDDLDLIPPRPLHERCVCCNIQCNCVIS